MTVFWKIVNRVIKDADVVLEILDARLIDETRNIEIEEKIKASGKPIIYVANKCDLVDKSYLDKKKKTLSPMVFVSSMEHLGTTMLRKKILFLGRKDIVTVGVVGYPNTGKSSLINALAGRGKAKTSSESGYTRGIQKIKADRRIRLLDTPGVIPFREDDHYKHALMGAVDSAKIKDPEGIVLEMIENFRQMIIDNYGSDDLDEIALKLKLLRKGGAPDCDRVSRKILSDWQRGLIRP